MRTKHTQISKSKDIIREFVVNGENNMVIHKVQFLDKGPECVDRYQIRKNGKIVSFSPFFADIEFEYNNIVKDLK